MKMNFPREMHGKATLTRIIFVGHVRVADFERRLLNYVQRGLYEGRLARFLFLIVEKGNRVILS